MSSDHSNSMKSRPQLRSVPLPKLHDSGSESPSELHSSSEVPAGTETVTNRNALPHERLARIRDITIAIRLLQEELREEFRLLRAWPGDPDFRRRGQKHVSATPGDSERGDR